VIGSGGQALALSTPQPAVSIKAAMQMADTNPIFLFLFMIIPPFLNRVNLSGFGCVAGTLNFLEILNSFSKLLITVLVFYEYLPKNFSFLREIV
jgi:hypothetical protein